jgi:hypothetical protein
MRKAAEMSTRSLSRHDRGPSAFATLCLLLYHVVDTAVTPALFQGSCVAVAAAAVADKDDDEKDDKATINSARSSTMLLLARARLNVTTIVNVSGWKCNRRGTIALRTKTSQEMEVGESNGEHLLRRGSRPPKLTLASIDSKQTGPRADLSRPVQRVH